MDLNIIHRKKRLKKRKYDETSKAESIQNEVCKGNPAI